MTLIHEGTFGLSNCYREISSLERGPIGFSYILFFFLFSLVRSRFVDQSFNSAWNKVGGNKPVETMPVTAKLQNLRTGNIDFSLHNKGTVFIFVIRIKHCGIHLQSHHASQQRLQLLPS